MRTKRFHFLATISLAIPVLLTQCTLFGGRPGSEVDKPLKVSFCELVRNPALFNNKVVRTEAMYYWNRENESFHDSKCGDEYVWAEYDASYAMSDDPMKKSLEQLPCAKPLCEARLRFVGLFQSSGGPYGHLDGYRFRLKIMRIENVKASPISQVLPAR